MPKYVIQETDDHKWVLINVPDDYQDGDILPAPSMRDQYFETRDEAIAALTSKGDQKK